MELRSGRVLGQAGQREQVPQPVVGGDLLGGHTFLDTFCCERVRCRGEGGFPEYLVGVCRRCEKVLLACSQDGRIQARPLALVYAPEAELRTYVVRYLHQVIEWQEGRAVVYTTLPGGPGTWDLESRAFPRRF